MLTELNNWSSAVGFKINRIKDQFIRSEDGPQGLIAMEIDEVENNEYVPGHGCGNFTKNKVRVEGIYHKKKNVLKAKL